MFKVYYDINSGITSGFNELQIVSIINILKLLLNLHLKSEENMLFITFN